MAADLSPALVAGGVSLVVAATAGVVTFLSTRASLKRDHDRQAADFQRAMTERLYDRRVAVYPGLFQATDAFRTPRLREAADLEQHLKDAIARVNAWHSVEGGLLLSNSAYDRLVDLRKAVQQYLEQSPSDAGADASIDEIREAKNRLRTAMRADLGLLFDEDQRAAEQAAS